jgi:hypothetical protein
MKLPHLSAVLLAGALLGTLHLPSSADAENWPGWRGPQANGTCREKDVPKRWDVATAAWKIEVPGIGHDVRSRGEARTGRAVLRLAGYQ